MNVGTLLDYKLRVHGLPLRWQSEITVWEPPFRFVDEQRHGPYRKWKHTHTFEEKPGGTLCLDHVEYAVLGGAIIGAPAGYLLARALTGPVTAGAEQRTALVWSAVAVLAVQEDAVQADLADHAPDRGEPVGVGGRGDAGGAELDLLGFEHPV